jgi:hypothetical protein
LLAGAVRAGDEVKKEQLKTLPSPVPGPVDPMQTSGPVPPPPPPAGLGLEAPFPGDFRDYGRDYGHDYGEGASRRFLELAVGYYRSTSLGPTTPDFTYVPFDVRLGCRPWYCGENTWRDRISLLLDLGVAPIITGPGNFLGGPSVLLRYDFCNPCNRLVPYFQLGAGVIFTDANKDDNQRAIGDSVEFLGQAELGLRYRLGERTSIFAEAGYQHISNGGLSDRNSGVNAAGGAIGVQFDLNKGR